MGDGNDTVRSGSGNDTIYGGDGDDIIDSGSGDDIIEGGKGNDTLSSGQGDDTYIYGKGDGKDIVLDTDGNDTLEFKEGIIKDDLIVKLSPNSNDLIVAIKEDGKSFEELSDVITIKEWLNANNRIENFRFSDGTVLDANDIINLQGTDENDTARFLDSTTPVNLSMGDGDDIVQSGRGDDIINGGKGDDVISGGYGNDIVDGGQGNDTIYGGSGNDIIDGGKGDDTLEGGKGDDTYIYDKGDGKDIVLDADGNDTLKFKEGITKDDLIVKSSPNSNDLIIVIKEDGKSFDELTDVITIKEWFNANNRIENFLFSDGTTLDANEILGYQETTDGDDYLRYLGGDMSIEAKKGDDTITGNYGNTKYIYGRGDGRDTITDFGGSYDEIALKDGITQDDIIIKVIGSQTIVAIKEEGKSFDELSDKIILVKPNSASSHGIEKISFSDGTSINTGDFISIYLGTEYDDNVDINYLQSINSEADIDDNFVIDLLDGYDTITLGNGSNVITNAEKVEVGNGNNVLECYSDNISIQAGDGNNDVSVKGNIENSMNISLGDGNNSVNIEALVSTSFGIEFGNGNNKLNVDNDSTQIAEISYGVNKLIYTHKYSSSFFTRFGNGNNAVDINGKLSLASAYFGDGDNVLNIQTEALKWIEEHPLSYKETIVKTDVSAEFGNGDNIVNVDRVPIDGHFIFGGGDNTFNIQTGSLEYIERYYYTDDESYDESNYTVYSHIIAEFGNGNNTVNADCTALDSDFTFGDGDNMLNIQTALSEYGERYYNSDGLYSGSNYIVNSHVSAEFGNGNNIVNIDCTVLESDFIFGDGDNIFSVQTGSSEYIEKYYYRDELYSCGREEYIGYSYVFAQFGNGNNIVDADFIAFLGGFTFGDGDNTVKIKDAQQFNKSYEKTEDYERYEMYAGGGGQTAGFLAFGNGNNNVDAELNNLNAVFLEFQNGNNNVKFKAYSGYQSEYYKGSDYTNDGIEFYLESDHYESSELDIFGVFMDGDNNVDLEGRFSSIGLEFNNGDNIVNLKIEQRITEYKESKFIDDNETGFIHEDYNDNYDFSGEYDYNNVFSFGNGDNILNIEGEGYFKTQFGNGDNTLNLTSGFSIYKYTDTFNNIDLYNECISILEADFADGNNTLNLVNVSANLSFLNGDNTVNLKIEQRVMERKESEFIDDNEIEFIYEYYNDSYDFLGEYGYNNEFYFGNGDNIVNIEGEGYFKAQFGNGDNTLNLTSGFSIYKYTDTLNNIDLYNEYNEYISLLDADFADGNNTLNLVNVLADLSFLNGDNTVNLKIEKVVTEYKESEFIDDNEIGFIYEYCNGSYDFLGEYYDGNEFSFGDGDNILNIEGEGYFIAQFGDGDNTLNLTSGFSTFKYIDTFNNIDLYNEYISVLEANFADGNNTLNLINVLANLSFLNGDNIVNIANDREVYITDEDGFGYWSTEGIVVDATHYLSFQEGFNTVNITGDIGSSVNITGSTSTVITLTKGDDSLYINNSGENKIIANLGNDTIYSQDISNDIYEFGIGDGEDRITDCGGIDRIVFKEGITKENIKVSILKEINAYTNQENFSIVIAYGENDKLILSNWFDKENRIESFEFEGGVAISDHEIVNLIGTNEGEFVLGTEGNNTLDAKFGDDIVSGGLGNDTYIFAKGYGHDTLEDSGGFDEIRFGEGIVKDDIIILKEGNDLHVYIKEEGKSFNELNDSMLIKNWFSESGMIERLVFANGDSVGLDELLKLDSGSIAFGGTSGDDELNGSNNDEVLIGLEGDDVINAGGGDDIVLGQDGNDTLDGGEGNDTLYGGDGNDTYIIRKNAGNDTIVDSSGDDRLLFEEGISFSDLAISFDVNDLIVELEGTRVTLQDWYFRENRIESFEFEDGTILSANDLQNLNMTNGNNIIKAFNEGSEIDTLDGDDELILGLGDDKFGGGNGDDTYYVNFSGKDKIFDVSGIDTIIFDSSINKENLKITWIQGSDDILLTCNDYPESSITIEGWYDKANRIENFVFADGVIWNAMDIISNMGTDEDDVYNGLKETSNIIVAKEGNDIISTFEHDDIVYGNDGDDTLDTRGGDDYLEGGTGDDLLVGGSGDDIYMFEGDFGHDVIKDDSGVDAIIFGANINKESLRFYSYENDTNLYIGIYEEGKEFEEFKNTITIQNWYKQENTIENILFVQSEEILSLRELVVSGNEGVARAYEEGGALMGTDGDDYLIGGSGQDEIYGLGGDDTVLGEDGDDMLDGGKGNDFLNAGKGDDLYIFGYGYGEDIIYDYAYDVQINYGFVKDSEGIDRWTAIETPYSVHAGTDTVFFSNGITKEDLILSNDGLDLIITLKDSNDKLTIKGFYDENSRIEKFHFEDGSILSASQMEELLFTDGDDDITFIDNIDRVAIGKDGDDKITTGSGNDILDGRGGDDILDGGFGDDVYVFGRGYGHDEIVEKRGEEWWQDYQGNDRVLIVGDVTEDDLIVKQIGNDLVIAIKEEGKEFEDLNDTLVIKNYSDIGFSVENIEIEDEIISILELLEKQNEDDNGEETPEGSIVGTPANDILYGDNSDNTIYGKEANDIIYGKDGNDTIYGNEGNDILFGQNGDDTIYGNLGNDIIYADDGSDTIEGGEGNDVIYAGKGDDIIVGGKDDDILYGEDGDDTYLFSIGDGRDIINDSKGNNSILFDEGINKDNISLYVKGNTLNISYSNSDSISATVDSIENIRLNDGSYLTSLDIELIIQNINAYVNDNGIQITSHDDIKNNESLMQIVSSGWNG
jgi:Ca2+-binding RTX toxin-like protein